MSIKKVKEFLEFFDYELRKKYQKDKEILFFRENILNLAQSYYIPNGKYQLIEKEYLKILFSENDIISGNSYQFDTSKTINNYYTNNDNLDDVQYHVKLILRTIIYIPNELITNNVEEENILIYQKKKIKQTKKKSLAVIKENEKNILDDKGNYSKKSKENKDLNEKECSKIFSSLGEIPKNPEHTEPNLLDIGKLLMPKESEDKINGNKNVIKKENRNNGNKEKDLIDVNENKKNEKISEKIKNINVINNNSKSKTKENNISDNSSNDDYDEITFDFTFNEEQVPTT